MPLYYPSPPASDAEDIELAHLRNECKTDDEEGPTKNDRHKWEHNHDTGSDDEDDFHSHTDEGNRALLGVQGKEREVHNVTWTSRVMDTWPHVKSMVIESAPILLLTTIGLLFTGKLLDELSQWRAMREVNQLIIIVPVVLNLKGNLEMNLSARLGTAANIGELDEPTHRWSLIRGNLVLLQVQATAVSFVAACMSLILGLMTPGNNEELVVAAQNATATLLSSNSTSSLARSSSWHLASHIARKPLPSLLTTPGPLRSGIDTFVIVTATAMLAACLSSCLLGSLMCSIIVLCRRWGYDPDNIAPPVASCLGDLLTLCLMGVASSVIIPYVETPLPLLIATVLLVSTSACLLSSFRNPDIRPLLSQGWAPLFGAMIISSGTGMVLDLFVSKYEDFAILAVVISGLPGSVGSIFVSRISTSLHAAALSASGAIAPPSSPTFTAPAPLSDKIVMLTLLIVTIPVEIIFLTTLELFGWLETPLLFVGLSLVFFCIAVFLSLLIGRFLTHTLWSWKRDPDMYALPLHSALMDLVGQGLLVICFEIASVLGAQVSLKPSS
ncbi:Mg transporter [Pluteus cervinus]|uniref:Mg transporter n=1 Tax=Pluteus cervinus TaxID=181527 RepID=A0ACD3AM76_9AGAR|nr:Mg transporter [Pluteus cervinus]